MPDRTELGWKVLCGALGLLVLYRFVLLLVSINPLFHVRIPPLPTLATEAATVDAGKATNSSPSSARAKAPAGTNQSQAGSKLKGTNLAPPVASAVTSPPAATSQRASNSLTNAGARLASAPAQTNSAPPQSTNRPDNARISRQPSGPSPTNVQTQPLSPPPGVRTRAGPGGPSQGSTLPGPIQARVDRIVESEILAPLPRPVPIALLGIAGANAFLRASSGQTGLLKEGEELGDVKLLRIGTNRVLVEQDGQKKELTIFSGYGGASLLPK